MRTALLERNTTDDIVALAVGLSVELQEGWDLFRRASIDTHLWVVQLVDAIFTCHVEGIVRHRQSLIQRPIEYQSFLCATKNAGVIAFYLLLRQGVVPKAHIIDVTLISHSHGSVTATNGQGGLIFLYCVPIVGEHIHGIHSQGIGSHIELPHVLYMHSSNMSEVVGTKRQRLEIRNTIRRQVNNTQVEVGAVIGIHAHLYGICQCEQAHETICLLALRLRP